MRGTTALLALRRNGPRLLVDAAFFAGASPSPDNRVRR